MTDDSLPSSSRKSGSTTLPSKDTSRSEVPSIGELSRNMLSVDFSTPLAGQARSERIKQMSNNHPAYENSRKSQEILVKVQHVLRRMPGVSSNESGEIISQLQEVGQIISQETSALVDALMNLQLDQEDTDKAVARMSIEANLAKAETDDKTHAISNLRAKLKAEEKKTEQAEYEAKQALEKFHSFVRDIRALKDKKVNEGDKSSGKNDLLQGIKDAIQDLDDEFSNSDTFAAVNHPGSRSASKAFGPNGFSAHDDEMMFRHPRAGQPAFDSDGENSNRPESKEVSRLINSFPSAPNRTMSAFQIPQHEPPSAGPPKMAHYSMGASISGASNQSTGPISRPSSTAPHNRGYQQNTWTGGPPHSYMNNRQGFPTSNSQISMSSFSRSSGRKAMANGPSRFSPASSDAHPQQASAWNYNGNASNEHQQSYSQMNRGGGPFHYSYRNSSQGNSSRSRDFSSHPPPQTPTGPARNNRYGRMMPQQEAPLLTGSDSNGSGMSNALVSTRTSAGPLVQVTDHIIKSWHDGIQEFYALTREFVERHIVSHLDIMLHKVQQSELWSIFVTTYHPLSAQAASSYLEFHLKQENSKSCLITRVVVDYVVNCVWVPSAWVGSDDGTSHALLKLEAEFEEMQGRPSADTQPLLDRQAAIINAIINNESSTGFCRDKIDEITQNLLSRFAPIIQGIETPTPTRRSNAVSAAAASQHSFEIYKDMQRVAEAAWEMSCRILTSRLTFDFKFPQVGGRFSSQSMLPIWPPVDPLELQARHWRIALVTTPVITCRNDTGNNISAHSVTLADVFCMQ